MAIPRKLAPKQEREVALAYLCGVDTDFLSQRYDVSDATIQSNIVAKRSVEWNDPLVEFYRKTNLHQRERNSAHLYLACNQKDVPQRELVRWPREEPVYQAVAADVFDPRIKKVMDRTGLEGYLFEKTGFEKLLEAVNSRWRSGAGIVEDLLVERLYEEYQKPENFSLDAVSRDVSRMIFHKIKYGALAITPKKAELIYEALGGLTPREQEIITLRFRLKDGGKPKTLDELAAQLEISRERARQIEVRALRKLPHPYRVKKLEFVAGLVTDEEVDAYRINIKEQEEKRQWYQRLYPEIEAEVLQKAAQNPSLLPRVEELKQKYKTEYDSRPIEELELSVRAANCLGNADIKTVGELCQRSERELLITKNFGRKSLKEIKEILAEMGLSLRK